MNASQRDELLIRLDEKTANTWRILCELEKHQKEQNGYLSNLAICVTRNTTRLKTITTISGIIFTGIIAAIVSFFRNN